MVSKGKSGERRWGEVTRRDFVKFCTGVAATMGLPMSVVPKMAKAVTSPQRPPVIWLSGQECTGCVESLLRTNHPTIDNLIFDLISLEYSETLNAGAGHQAEHHREKSIEANKGKFVLVVDGAIPVKDGGVYCQIAGKPVLDILKETAPLAGAVIAIGSCASWGGVAAASPNPTGATPVHKILEEHGISVVNIPGCPPNPYNFLSTVIHFLTFGKLPALDAKGRPLFAYDRRIHENCERRPHFDAGRFAEQFGDESHRKGYCLYKLGCKGPETFNNCSTLHFGDVSSTGCWPVATGAPCFGCSEENVGFSSPLFSKARVSFPTPPRQFTEAVPEKGGGAKSFAYGVAGVAVGATAVALANLRGKDEE
ncbi:hydrogenase small subunit [Desulfogranum japonicum]|uniref:hydrogenase small subunit n=1 Tax=Desulfogranum japonicum TaxID=231447 RepID=UPI0006847439|nr:hydrogenase small subunit [Desulfogranum japonicum]